MLAWFEKHNNISWIISVIIAIFIFYVSSLTFEGMPGTGTNTKAILYHLTAFFLFSGILMISLTKGKNLYLIIPAVFIALIYAASDEIHQSFVPGRASTLFDFAINSIGILFSILVYSISLELRK